MEEIEDPTEQIHDKIMEEAGEEKQRARDKWIMSVALFTAIISVLAAFSGMLSAHHENESLIAQLHASDQWAYYQAKGIKKEIVSYYVRAQGSADTAAINKSKQYDSDQAEIKLQAQEFEKEMDEHLNRHLKIARAVTLFQITIAISAISILTRRKIFWYLGMLFAVAGCVFLVTGIM